MTEHTKIYNGIKTRKGSLAERNIISLVLLGIFLFAAVCLLAGQLLYVRNIRLYTDHFYSSAHFLADDINGIAPTKYLATGEKDAEYYDIRYTLMTAGLYDAEFRDVYLAVPTEEDLIYISEIYHNLPEGRESLSDVQHGFLDHAAYQPGEKETMMSVLAAGPDRKEKLFMELRELDGEKLATVLVPLRYMEGEVPALVGIDVSVASIWDSLMNLYVMLALAVLGITSVGILAHYRILKQTLIIPITRLKAGTDQLAGKLDSEEDFDAGIHTGDEIEALAHSIEEMDRDLKRKTRELVSVTAEQEHVRTELELSGNIQMSMLPRSFPAFPDRNEFDLYASMVPAKEVGGDFYDFFLIDPEHLGLVIADVSGKGVPAALFMMMVKIMVQNCLLAGLSPGRAMEQVNRLLSEHDAEGMFVTVWLGVLDLPSGRLTAVNAGHEYPILKKPGGAYELLRDKHGIAAGVMPECRYREYELQLEPGSGLFVYTDGLPEANDAEGKMFGLDRTLAAVNENPEAAAEETLKNVGRRVDAFIGQAARFDDLTMMCLIYHGPEAEKGEAENA